MTNSRWSNAAPGSPGLDLGAPEVNTGKSPLLHPPEQTSEKPVSQTPVSAPATARPQLEPFPNIDPPTKGRAKRQFQQNLKDNVEDANRPGYLLVPPPGKREQRQRDKTYAALQQAAYNELPGIRLAIREQYRKELIERLCFLANLGIQPIVYMAAIKSAGKTSDALGLGNTVSKYTRLNGLVLPATTNTDTATLGLMAGIGNYRLSIGELCDKVKEFPTARDFTNRVPRTTWGLNVVTEEDDEQGAKVSNEVTIERFITMMDAVVPLVTGIIILDGGNDNITNAQIPAAGIKLCHTVNVPYMATDPITKNMVRKTHARLANEAVIPVGIEEHFGAFESKRFTGLSIPVEDKVKQSIVVANKAVPEKVVDFKSIVNGPAGGTHTDGFDWNGLGVFVPNDPSIGRVDENDQTMPFNHDQLQLDTEIGYLELAVLNYELTGLRLPDLELEAYGYQPMYQRFTQTAPENPSFGPDHSRGLWPEYH